MSESKQIIIKDEIDPAVSVHHLNIRCDDEQYIQPPYTGVYSTSTIPNFNKAELGIILGAAAQIYNVG